MPIAPKSAILLQRWERNRLAFWRWSTALALGAALWLSFHPLRVPATHADNVAHASPPSADPRSRVTRARSLWPASLPAATNLTERLDALQTATTAMARCNALNALSNKDADESVVAKVADHTEAAYTLTVRTCAIGALAGIPHSAAADCLAGLLDDPDYAVRFATIQALGARTDDASRDALLEVARTSPPELQVQAAVALTPHHPNDAIPLLMRLIQTQTGQDQLLLIRALGESKFPGAVKPLALVLKSGTTASRMEAVNALAAIGDPAAVTALIATLRTGGPREAYAVANALAQLEDPSADAALREVAMGQPLEPALAALHALSYRNDDRSDALMKKLLFGGDEPRASAAAAYFNQRADSSLLPDLIALTRTGTVQRAETAVSIIANIGGSAAREALIALAREGGPCQAQVLMHLSQQPGERGEVRALALEVLKKGGNGTDGALSILANDGSPEARDAMIELAKGDTGASRSAISWLAQQGDRVALDALQSIALRADSAEARSVALSALVNSGETRALPVLTRVLQSPEPRLRAVALSGLADLGGEQAERAILAAASDRDPQTAYTAVASLGQLATPAALERLGSLAQQGDGDLSAMALMQVSRIDSARGAELATALVRSESNTRRLAAIQAAAMLPQPAAEQILVRGAGDSDPSVAQAALSQLPQLGSDIASKTLVSVLKDPRASPETHARAAEALSAFGGQVAEDQKALITQFRH